MNEGMRVSEQLQMQKITLFHEGEFGNHVYSMIIVHLLRPSWHPAQNCLGFENPRKWGAQCWYVVGNIPPTFYTPERLSLSSEGCWCLNLISTLYVLYFSMFGTSIPISAARVQLPCRSACYKMTMCLWCVLWPRIQVVCS
jgi:hypothetical protein